MGRFGLATALATACAPALGLALMEKIGFGTLFAVAAACAGLSLVLLFLMKLPKVEEKKLPLVVLMHDMGSVSPEADAVLKQGIGSPVWADGKEHRVRPCYVPAPEHEEKSAFDDFTVGWVAEATVELIRHLCRTLNIDTAHISKLSSHKDN